MIGGSPPTIRTSLPRRARARARDDAPRPAVELLPLHAGRCAGRRRPRHYAYRDLGWRSAVIVAEDWGDGWEAAAGFVTEFCALGGSVVERDWAALQPTPPPPPPATRAPPTASSCSTASTARCRTSRRWRPRRATLAASGARRPERPRPGGAGRGRPRSRRVWSRPARSRSRRPPRVAHWRAWPGVPRATPAASFLGSSLPNYVSMAAFVAALEAAAASSERPGDAARGLAALTLRRPRARSGSTPTGRRSCGGYLRADLLSPRPTGRLSLRGVDGGRPGLGGAIAAAAPQPTRTSPRPPRATPPWAG